MGQFRVYLKPFDDYGVYTDWQEITKFVSEASIGDMKVSLDGSEFQLGVFTNSTIKLSLNNVGGEFLDIDQTQSLFRYKRGDSQVKITWAGGESAICGISILGECSLFDEVEIYKGLIADETFSSDIERQQASISILGLESIFAKAVVPYGTISAGDMVSDILFNILNVPAITNLLTVDALNISVSLDQAIDSIASLQNKTVKEGLDTLLSCSNSVLYIHNDTIYITGRIPTATVQATFYGQASQNGAENISSINNFTNGAARVFNFIRWSNGTSAVTDSDSVTRFGLRKKELDYEIFTDSTKIGNILTAIKAEFASARQEFDLVVPLNYFNLDLGLLDKILVDYPTTYLVSEGATLPLCGFAVWGEFQLPYALWALTISVDDEYKIISKNISFKNQTITFRARKI